MSRTIYRQYATVEELNGQYDVEANPRTGEHVADFIARSEQARAELDCRLDVPFGPTFDETFDVFSGGAGLRPTVFFVHGGWWKVTTSKFWSYLAYGPAAHGITTVVENYSLCPKVSVSEIVRQHRAAFATMWRRADELGIDRDNIVIAGHSAGGHAVAALLDTDWVGEYGLPAQPYKATIPISGVFDLLPMTRCWLAPYLQLSLAEVTDLSYLTPFPALPQTLAVVGGEESEEFHRQTREWTEAHQADGLPARWTAPAGRDHFTILEELADPKGQITQAVLEFLS